MTRRVVYRRSALRKLASLPVPDRERVFNAVNALAEDPGRGTPLKGDLAGLYRFRVGDWRVIYELGADEETLIVRAVGPRPGDVYK